MPTTIEKSSLSKKQDKPRGFDSAIGDIDAIAKAYRDRFGGPFYPVTKNSQQTPATVPPKRRHTSCGMGCKAVYPYGGKEYECTAGCLG